jgi:hypothetical protein
MARLSVGAAALVVVALGLVAGCGGSDHDPAPKFSTSPTVTSSAPTSPAPVTSSSAPAQETPEAFIRRWAQIDTEMQNSGDTTAFDAITHTCKPCAQAAAKVESYYKAGGYIKFGGHQILDITRVQQATGDVFDVAVRDRPTEYKQSAGAPVSNLAGGPAMLEFTLKRRDSGWNITYLTQLAS